MRPCVVDQTGIITIRQIYANVITQTDEENVSELAYELCLIAFAIDVCFGSEADTSQGWPRITGLESANGQKRTLAMQKETRSKAGS